MNFTHPAFDPYRELLAQLDGDFSLAALNRLAERMNARHSGLGTVLRFAATGNASAADYELGIARSGTIPTRENNLHDLMNALVWMRFPRLKSALNLQHCLALTRKPEELRQRGRQRDQLTLLDESGMIVVSSSHELLELLRLRDWLGLFWHRRPDVISHMRFIIVGHGLLEKCLAPFPAMTAKCLLLCSNASDLGALDGLAAASIRDDEWLDLPPLPVQGVPGWDENESRAYYQNTAIFRPARTPPPAA